MPVWPYPRHEQWAISLTASLGQRLESPGYPWPDPHRHRSGHHLLLAGAMALAILIVMSVAGRMHSGHGLDHRRWLPITGGLLLVVGLLRAAASLPAFAAAYLPLLHSSATLWLIAWGIYLGYSLRPLAGPRPDGKAGCDEA